VPAEALSSKPVYQKEKKKRKDSQFCKGSSRDHFNSGVFKLPGN
jgi:hypothetical protein